MDLARTREWDRLAADRIAGLTADVRDLRRQRDDLADELVRARQSLSRVEVTLRGALGPAAQGCASLESLAIAAAALLEES